ncbi:heavy-metal-associated domain-containing protein [Acidobacteria bacterium AH-259-O06]|nr:heavy-metal-associated domain-containing protein [Acidobacteria bacterium AH-259-O06]
MTKKRIFIALPVILVVAVGIFLATTMFAEKQGRAEIVLQEGASVSKEQLANALEGTHFTIKDLKTTAEGKLICDIEGMKCGGCPSQVEAALKKVDGVQVVKAVLLD